MKNSYCTNWSDCPNPFHKTNACPIAPIAAALDVEAQVVLFAADLHKQNLVVNGFGFRTKSVPPGGDMLLMVKLN
ncbi:MAG: hypothetical protein R2788_00515 [Saprospiraceae bacterium]